MTSSPSTALHRTASRLLRAFGDARIPVPLPTLTNDLAAAPHARLASLRQADLDTAFRALRTLQARLDFLCATDGRTRAALARWADLEDAWGGSLATNDALTQARAFTAGAALLPRVARPPTLVTGTSGGGGAGDAPTAGAWAETAAASHFPEDEEDERGHAASAAAGEAALDALAADAVSAAPAGSFDGGTPPPARLAALAAALGGGSTGGLGLRAAPVEWLYSGLAPLLLGPVAASRRGAPLGVAAVAAGVAARLGIPTVPAGLVVGAENNSDSAAAALARALPPDRAARLAGRAASLASAPPGTSDAWVLVCPDGTWAWDPSSGRVERGGGEQSSLPALAASAAGLKEGSNRVRLALGARRAWCALLRTAVVAHTRRGDAEAVAGILPQLLALDADTEEWGIVLP